MSLFVVVCLSVGVFLCLFLLCVHLFLSHTLEIATVFLLEVLQSVSHLLTVTGWEDQKVGGQVGHDQVCQVRWHLVSSFPLASHACLGSTWALPLVRCPPFPHHPLRHKGDLPCCPHHRHSHQSLQVSTSSLNESD